MQAGKRRTVSIQTGRFPYQNRELSSIERAEDLVGRMTIEEKAQQLTCVMVAGVLEESQIKDGIGEATLFLGPVSAGDIASAVRKLQDAVMGQSRFGIPALVHAEALSGPMAADCAVFPTSIGLGATFEPKLVENMADRIREQMVNLGIRQALSPVLDLIRDFRWGRIGEDYGSDPTLVSEMACAYVRGLQGKDLRCGVAATAKHFLGYSQTEGGLNGPRTVTDWRDMRENFAKPFEAVIRRENLQSVMNSYAEYDGELICGSKRILTDLLREDLGFDGVTVSDYTSIENMVEKCPMAENAREAGARSLRAGLDVELPMPYGYGKSLVEAVREGLVDEKTLDRSVKRILKLKFALGLFESPYGEFQKMDNRENDRQSAKVSEKLMTLTKNNGILPLKNRNLKIAVIGPTGDNLLMLNGAYTYPASMEMFLAMAHSGSMGMEGVRLDADTFGYSEEKIKNIPDFTEEVDAMIRSQHPGAKTIAEALAERYSSVTYIGGCHIIREEETDYPMVREEAAKADVVILTVGGKIGMMTECSAGESRDNVDIGLPGSQARLAREVLAVNRNVVIVHTDNKPLVDPELYEQAAAILEGWLPGPYGGIAIAATICGDNNPGGKLPVDVPRHVGQTPVYFYQHTGCRSDQGMRSINPDGYGTMTCAAQLPFGYGLSYTSFTYSGGDMEEDVSGEVPVLCLSIEVENTGTCRGDEVVQLYGTDKVASIVRPQKELIGFYRVSLEPGEKKRVALSFRLDQLAFADPDGRWVIEKGEFLFYFGRGCNDPVYQTVFRQPKTIVIDRAKRGFFAEGREEKVR